MRVLLLTCALVASVSAKYFPAKHFTTEGSAGQVCGRTGIICPPEESSCQNKKCVCGSGNGQSALRCAQDEENYSSSIVSDFKVTTIEEEHFRLSVPCMVFFSSVVTTMLPATFYGSNAKCHTKFYVYPNRIKGKMFVGGARVEVRTKDVKDGDYIRGFNIEGRANNGSYDFWLSISKDLETWSDTINNRSFKIKGAAYVFTVESETNRARLIVPACGFQVHFRPADAAVKRYQKMLPGIMIEYLSYNNPVFDFKNQVIALPPNVSLSQATGSDLTTLQEFTVRGFMFALRDLIYRDSSMSPCNYAIDAMRSCPEGNIKKATQACHFMLYSSSFVECFSFHGVSHSGQIVYLYAKCLEAYCHSDRYMCESVQYSIIGTRNCYGMPGAFMWCPYNMADY